MTSAAASASISDAAAAETVAPELSVVVVNWNAGEAVTDCLMGLRAASEHLRLQVIVVDNASTDGSRERLAAEFPECQLLANQRNAGFARANNQAFPHCRGRYLLLLNPDTVVTHEALRGLIDFMDRSADAGAAGLQLCYPDGRLQNSYDSFPSLATELLSKHLLRILFPGKFPSKRIIPDRPVPVDLVIGACLIIRAPLFRQLGGFDENYFLFVEETDLCKRVWNAGWKVYHLPHLKICHSYHPSKAQAPAHAHIESWRSGYYYFKKHRHPLLAILYRVLKTLKLLSISFPLILFAQLFTLGRVQRYRRRLMIRRLLSAWHLLGCPRSWGMRQVSGFRDYERSFSKAAGRSSETIIPRLAGRRLKEILEDPRPLLSGGVSGVEVLKKGRFKTSYRIAIVETAPLLLTLYRPRHRFTTLAGLVRVPEGIGEFEKAILAAERGIPVIPPAGAGALYRWGLESFSYIAYMEDPRLVKLQSRLYADAGAKRDSCRRAWVEAYGRFVRRLHEAGVDQYDLNPGNALIRAEADPAGGGAAGDEILLADLERVELERPLDEDRRRRALARLNRLRAGLTAADRLRFLKAYLGGGADWKSWACSILDRMPALRAAEGERVARTCVTENWLFGRFAEELLLRSGKNGGSAGRRVKVQGHFRRRAYPWEDRVFLDQQSVQELARRTMGGEKLPAPLEVREVERSRGLREWREANRAFQSGRSEAMPVLYLRSVGRDRIVFRSGASSSEKTDP
ncbi:MAG: glycosyltransferase [Planctomycetes bacterium]|nr:glycosyltransferase [Planctomycetota bacterium]